MSNERVVVPGTQFRPTPVDSRKRAEQVRDGIIAMIRSNQLANGDKLPTESQFAEMFGVGRSSIREAVQSLIGLGIVEMRPGRGAFVSRISVDDLARMLDGVVELERGAALQLHEVRAMIEISAARLAAVRRTEQDLELMKQGIDGYADGSVDDPDGTLVESDLFFHRTIVHASQNVILAGMLASIAGLLREHRRQYASEVEGDLREVVLTEHQAIFDAIAGGHPEQAALAMQAHMLDIWSQIEQTARGDGDASSIAQTYLPMYPSLGTSE